MPLNECPCYSLHFGSSIFIVILKQGAFIPKSGKLRQTGIFLKWPWFTGKYSCKSAVDEDGLCSAKCWHVLLRCVNHLSAPHHVPSSKGEISWETWGHAPFSTAHSSPNAFQIARSSDKDMKNVTSSPSCPHPLLYPAFTKHELKSGDHMCLLAHVSFKGTGLCS